MNDADADFVVLMLGLVALICLVSLIVGIVSLFHDFFKFLADQLEALQSPKGKDANERSGVRALDASVDGASHVPRARRGYGAWEESVDRVREGTSQSPGDPH